MICTKCKRDLPLDDFPFRNKTKGTYRRECKECNRQLQKEIYDRNNLILEQWKSAGCVKCGESRPWVIDAHHVDPSVKEGTISRLRVNCSTEKLEAELAKCIPFCANCHREYHWLVDEQGITLEDFMGM